MSATTKQLDQIKVEVQRLEAENDRLRRDGYRSLYIYADGRIENKPRMEHTGPVLYLEELNFPMSMASPPRWAWPTTYSHARRVFRILGDVGDLRVYGEI